MNMTPPSNNCNTVSFEIPHHKTPPGHLNPLQWRSCFFSGTKYHRKWLRDKRISYLLNLLLVIFECNIVTPLIIYSMMHMILHSSCGKGERRQEQTDIVLKTIPCMYIKGTCIIQLLRFWATNTNVTGFKISNSWPNTTVLWEFVNCCGGHVMYQQYLQGCDCKNSSIDPETSLLNLWLFWVNCANCKNLCRLFKCN